MTDWPWAPGSATGVGSLPGSDVVEATAMVFGELSLPHLVELPGRGAGADMIGRGAGLLTDLPVELYAGAWRVAAHGGLDLRRTRDFLDRDLDVLTEAAEGYQGPLKLQAPGPWTLAASLDLPIGGRLLHDHGATRDLAESLTDGLTRHVVEVARRVPGATILLQLDEPSVSAVLNGRVPTESGLRTLRSVARSTVESTLRSLIEAVGVPVILHCCAPRPPIRLFQAAGATAVSVDLALVGTDTAAQDELGELLDAGLGLFAGAVPTTGGGRRGGSKPPSAEQVAASVTDLWKRLSFAADRLPEQVVITPACGLAGQTPAQARATLTTCATAARHLTD